MENKELEKLVRNWIVKQQEDGRVFNYEDGDYLTSVCIDGYINLQEFALSIYHLADKQGYLRALKEVDEALPKRMPEFYPEDPDLPTMKEAGWNSYHNYAHDAIKRLREGV